MMRIILALLMTTATLAVIPACNTVKGAGQDMKSGGQSIEETAKENGANSK